MRKKFFLLALFAYVGIEIAAWIARPGGLFPRTPSGYVIALWHHTHGLPDGSWDIVDGLSCGYSREEARPCEDAVADFDHPQIYTGCVQKLTRRWGASTWWKVMFQKPPVFTQCTDIVDDLRAVEDSCEPHMFNCIGKFGSPAFYYTDEHCCDG